ncbi:hypothetical protein KI387_022171, partial [Taxus chinensis]
EIQRRQEIPIIQRPPSQTTGHVGNLSVANPLDGEFPYINANVEYFTDIETKEEAREREARVDKEIRAQLKETERLQPKVDERATIEVATLTRLEDRNRHTMGDPDHERECDHEAQRHNVPWGGNTGPM